jgi:hypothetical protein
MILVVLGAGASKDSNRKLGGRGNDDIRMPLANELFADRPEFEAQLTAFPAVRPVVERLRDSVRGEFAEGIEAALEVLREEAADDPMRGVQLNAVLFYLHAIMSEAEAGWVRATSGVSNLAELLDRLRNTQSTSGEPVRVVSFNYDTLIDSAFKDALSIDVEEDDFLDAYTARKDFRLYKVHGSINWAQVVNNKTDYSGDYLARAQRLIKLGRDLKPASDAIALARGGDPTLVADARGQRHVSMPAMALPLTSKSDFVMPSKHVKQLRTDLQSVRRVIVIGWKAADERLLDVWREEIVDDLSPDLLVISGSSDHASETVNKLMTANIFGTGHAYHRNGFSDFLIDKSDPLGEFLAGQLTPHRTR